MALVLTLLGPPAVLADSPSPSKPWKQVVGDYVFVMLFSRCERHVVGEALISRRELELLRDLRRDASQSERTISRLSWSNGNVPPTESCRRNEVPVIKERLGDAVLVGMEITQVVYQPSIQSSTGEYYPASGLYRNDGSVEPLWTVDWFSDSAIVAPDGEHLVRLGPWASGYEVLAVAFYRSGRFLKGYSVTDLVANPEELMHTVSHFFWRREISLDEERGELYVATQNGEEYRFRLSDGEITWRKAAPEIDRTMRVRYENGDTRELSDAHTCAGTGYLITSITEGKSARRNFYARGLPLANVDNLERTNDQSRSRLLKLLTIPLDQIRGIRRTDHGVERDANTQGWDEKAWLIRLKNGQSILTAIDVAELRLCAKNDAGEQIVLALEGVTAIDFP